MLLINYSVCQKSKFCNSSSLKMNIFRFLYSSMTVNCISLGCGPNKTLEDISLGFEKHRLTFFTIIWLRINATSNWLIKKIIYRFTDNTNNHQLLQELSSLKNISFWIWVSICEYWYPVYTSVFFMCVWFERN